MAQEVPLYVPSDEEKKLHAEFIAEAHKREMASTDNFDKSVLTLSSAGLGLSISFLKDFGGQSVLWPWVLYGSWILFVAATLSTMLSFMSSVKALELAKHNAKHAYLEGDWAAFDAPNKWNKRTIGLNYSSALTFFFAFVFTIIFVIVNVQGRTMATSTNTPTSQLEKKGLAIPTMQRPTPATSQPVSPPAAPSGGSSGSSKQS